VLRYLFARRTDWTVFVLACAASLTLMLLGPRSQARAAWFLQHTLLAPVEIVVGWMDRGVAVYWDNQKLRDRVTRLTIDLDATRVEGAENDRLRRLLSLTGRRAYELKAANVVGRSLDRLGGSLAIDKGSDEGIEANRAILTPDGLVGRVERITRHSARVLTLLHRDCAVAARIERSRVDGVVRWEYGDRPMLDLLYVSSQEDVKRGDRVVTSGLGGIFPAGVRIGTVERVALESNGLTKEITVKPAVDFRALEEVLVFTPAKGSPLPSDFYPMDAPDTAGTAPTVLPGPPALGTAAGDAPSAAPARASGAPGTPGAPVTRTPR